MLLLASPIFIFRILASVMQSRGLLFQSCYFSLIKPLLSSSAWLLQLPFQPSYQGFMVHLHLWFVMLYCSSWLQSNGLSLALQGTSKFPNIYSRSLYRLLCSPMTCCPSYWASLSLHPVHLPQFLYTLRNPLLPRLENYSDMLDQFVGSLLLEEYYLLFQEMLSSAPLRRK